MHIKMLSFLVGDPSIVFSVSMVGRGYFGQFASARRAARVATLPSVRRACLGDISCMTCNCSATRVVRRLDRVSHRSLPSTRRPAPSSHHRLRADDRPTDRPTTDHRLDGRKSRPGPDRPVHEEQYGSGRLKVCNYDVSDIPDSSFECCRLASIPLE